MPHRQACFSFDTRDDHKEILYLIGKLSPKERMAWMVWCCQRSYLDPNYPEVKPRPRPSTWELARQAMSDDAAAWKLQHDLYQDFWKLNLQWHLDPDEALEELVRRARLLRRIR